MQACWADAHSLRHQIHRTVVLQHEASRIGAAKVAARAHDGAELGSVGCEGTGARRWHKWTIDHQARQVYELEGCVYPHGDEILEGHEEVDRPRLLCKYRDSLPTLNGNAHLQAGQAGAER